MNDIMKSLEDSSLLIRGVSEAIKFEAKEQRDKFFSMLLGTLGARLLRNLLVGKGFIRAVEGTIGTSWGRGTIRADHYF